MDNSTTCITSVRFEPFTSSRFVHTTRMHFMRNGREFTWDMAMEHDSVACLLYHKGFQKILLVKQFRPPVFVHSVKRLEENKDKQLDEIKWDNYPISMGETTELCAGMMDKFGLSPAETVRMEIIEECGYDVPLDKIVPVRQYMTGISLSGSSQCLFYAVIDESMKVTEGGGIPTEGEFIEKIFIDINEAGTLLTSEGNLMVPPSLLFALSWFFINIQPEAEATKK